MTLLNLRHKGKSIGVRFPTTVDEVNRAISELKRPYDSPGPVRITDTDGPISNLTQYIVHADPENEADILKQIIALCLTAFLQSTILVAGLMVFNENALLGLGLMLSANEVPRIAGAFGLDTSTRANLMGAVHTAQCAVGTVRTVQAMIK